MRQFLNFPQGIGKYKDLKINVAGISASVYTIAGESIVYVPLLANFNTIIALEVDGTDQSDERYKGIADNINNALTANPGGVSVDIINAPINNVEVTEV